MSPSLKKNPSTLTSSSGGSEKNASAAASRKTTPATKRKRRLCQVEGCDRTVKSQRLCQRHGAKPRTCRVDGCPKQAQGSFDGMCKLHYKEKCAETATASKSCSDTDETNDKNGQESAIQTYLRAPASSKPDDDDKTPATFRPPSNYSLQASSTALAPTSNFLTSPICFLTHTPFSSMQQQQQTPSFSNTTGTAANLGRERAFSAVSCQSSAGISQASAQEEHSSIRTLVDTAETAAILANVPVTQSNILQLAVLALIMKKE